VGYCDKKMEISVLIAAIGALCGVIGYLYRELAKINKTVVKDLRDDLARRKAINESLRAEIRVLRNGHND